MTQFYFRACNCYPMDQNIFKTLQTNDEKENYVLEISKQFISSGDYLGLLNFLKTLESQWKELSVARLTKVIKKIFENITIEIGNFEELRMFLKGLIEWSEHRKMLKLDLECKLINVYLSVGRFTECLEKISSVLKELKKYDDRSNLIALYVCESKAYYELMDFNKAKSSLTSARALAVSSACKPQLQAQIDLLNGMYLSDEKSFDTAISYFIESLEGFLQDKHLFEAKVALRYIILNKILLNRYDDIPAYLSSKLVTPIKDDQFVNLLCDAAETCKKRDLRAYNKLLSDNSIILDTDLYAKRHLIYLYNILLDRNILKIIEPYSHIRINFIASKLQLSEELIEEKLRKMILDRKITGILDNDTQCLILFDSREKSADNGFKGLKLIEEYFAFSE